MQRCIIDMIMPNIRGDDVLTALREANANIPVIIASGFSETKTLERMQNAPAVYAIAKPYRAKRLLALLDKVVNART